jgi:hypothetical protein
MHNASGWIVVGALAGLLLVLDRQQAAGPAIYAPSSDGPGVSGAGILTKLGPGGDAQAPGSSGPPDPILPPTVGAPAPTPATPAGLLPVLAPTATLRTVAMRSLPAARQPQPTPDVYTTPYAGQAAALGVRPGSLAPFSGAAGRRGLPPGASSLVGYIQIVKPTPQAPLRSSPAARQRPVAI